MPRAAVTTGSARAPDPRTATTRATATIMPDDDSWFTPAEDHPDYLNLVYWGREGGGKTTDALTACNVAPEGSRVLLINAEGGFKKDALRRRGIRTDNLVIFPRSDDPSHRITREDLASIFRRVSADLHNEPSKWFAVVWDSGSEITNLILDQVQAARVAKARRAAANPAVIDEFFVDRDDYGTTAKMMRDLLRDWRDLPCHFVMTCLERRDIDADTKKPQYGPALTPKIAGDVLGYSDLVLFTKAADEKGPYRAMTKESARYRCKDRFGMLPRVMATPTFERILRYYEDTLSEETDPEQKIITRESIKSLESVVKEADEDDEDEEESEDDTPA